MAIGREWYQRPPVIVAFGFGAAPVLAAALWGLAVVLEKVLNALGVLLETVAIAIGLGWTIAVSGVVAAGTVPTWLVPAAAVGVGAAGVAAGGKVAITIVKKAQENPLQIWLPILGILGGLSVDIAQEFLGLQPLVQHSLSAFAAIMVMAGGVLYGRGGLARPIGIVLHLVPALLIVLKAMQTRGAESLVQAVYAVPLTSWTALLGFGTVALATLGITVEYSKSKPG